ncbi:MAG: hypothetical protein QOF69_1334 [Solirubrobacteraceae bacterium]|nr:hypothetical protein [Solirubrobacteraceae bacterium]
MAIRDARTYSGEGDHVHRFTRLLKTTLVAAAGVVTALAVAGLTQASAGGALSASTSTTKTATTPTTTTPVKTTTTPTKTTTTPAISAPKATTRDVTCKAALIAAVTPIDNAENFGTLKCSSPLGKGVQHDRSKITRPTSTTGTYTGSFTLFFNTGTLRGSWRLTFVVATGKATYEGTMKISSGTGEFKSVKGTGTITGTSGDLVHTALAEKLTLTIPAPKK